MPMQTDAPNLSMPYKWLRPIGVLISCQFIFWIFLFTIETKTQPENFVLPEQLPLYLENAEGEFDLSSDPILVPYNNEPAYIYKDASKSQKGMFIIEFELATQEIPAFYVGWDGTVEGLILNGEPIPIGAKRHNINNMSGYAPGIYKLPQEFIRPGRNSLGITVDGENNKFISHFAIGEFEDLEVNYQWAQAISYALPYASLGAGVFVLALCLLIPWSRDDAMRITVFGIVLLASIARNLQFFGFEIASEVPWIHVFHFMSVFLLLMGFPALAIAWTNGSWQSLRKLVWIYGFAVGLIIISVPVFEQGGRILGMNNIFFWGWQLETFLTVAAAVFVFGRLLWASQTATPVRLIEYVIILFCMMVILVEHVDHRLRLDFPFVEGLPIKNYFTSIVSVVLPARSMYYGRE